MLRDPGSLRLHQAEYPFSPRSLIRCWLIHEMHLVCEPVSVCQDRESLSCADDLVEAFIGACQSGETGPSRKTSIGTLSCHFNCGSKICRSPTSQSIKPTFTFV